MNIHALHQTTEPFRPSTGPGFAPKRPKKGKSLRNILLLGAVVAIGYGGYSLVSGGTAAPAAPSAPSVAVSAPLQRTVESQLQALGQFSAVEHVELRPQVGGTLTAIHFKDGDIVKKGALLFTIDATPYEIKYSQAQAQLESAQAKVTLANQELARAKILKKSDAGSSENVEQKFADAKTSQATVDEAKSALRDAKFDLDHTIITAPFTGRIGTHQVSVGNLIAGSRAATSPTTLLTTLVSMDPIYLNFDMSEADYMSFLKERTNQNGALANNAVAISLTGDTDYSHKGTLDFIDNSLDRSSGTIHARATVPNKDLQITPGGFGRVKVAVSDGAPALLVPDAAVLNDQDSHMVFTVGADNKVTPKTVKVGDLRDGLRVITSGLDASDKIIIDSIPTIRPGEVITPTSKQITAGADDSVQPVAKTKLADNQ